MRLSIIILTLAGLSFFSAILGSGLYYYSLKEVALNQSLSNAESQAQIIKNRVSAFVVNQQSVVTLLSKHPAFGRYLQSSDLTVRVAVDTLLDESAGLLSGSVCYLIDPNGITVASSNRFQPNSFVGKNYGFRPYFKEAVTGRVSVYFALGITSGVRGVYTGAPIYSPDGRRILGVIVIKASIDELERELISDTVGTWVLAAGSGIVFSSNRHQWLLQRLWQLSEIELVQVKRSKQFGIGPWGWIGLKKIDSDEAVDRNGRRFVFSEDALESVGGWRVYYLVDPDTLFETMNHPLVTKGKYSVLILCGIICGLTVVLYNNARIDIARRKSMEHALRQSEERFRTIFHTTPDPLGISRFADGRFIDVNEGLCRVSGYRRQEILGKTSAELGLWQSIDDLDQLANAMKRGGKIENLEVVLRSRCGELRSYLLSACGIELDGELCILSTTKDIEELKRVQKRLEASETYLRTLMSTIQTGVVVVDAATEEVVDANPFAADMLKGKASDLIGRSWRRSPPVELPETLDYKNSPAVSQGRTCALPTLDGGNLHVRHTSAEIRLKNQDYRIESFLDISDIIDLMQIQAVNIDLAKNVLRLINGRFGGGIPSRNGCRLFVDALSIPCYAEGGDHFFVRHLHDSDADSHVPLKTVVSLKDQSGHEVSCVLRSILTDLVHHAIISRNGRKGPDDVIAELNKTLVQSGLFQPDDFFTAVYAVIDHTTLVMQYVFAGHPPFLLIRDSSVQILPQPGAIGTNPPMTLAEDLSFSYGTFQLEIGDRLVGYTDGLIEMPVKNGGRVISLQELQRTAEKIIAQKPGIHVREMMQSILNRIAADCREQVAAHQKNTSADDVTLIGLEIETAHFDGQKTLQSHLQPIPDQIASLYQLLADRWRHNGFDAPRERLRIVLEESVLNAWHHGNRQRQGTAVVVRWRFGNQFHLEVVDEGDGFDYKRLPNPVDHSNLTASSGRGIYVMRYYADDLYWKDGGRCLAAVFNKARTKKTGFAPFGKPSIDLWRQSTTEAA